jgi:hypothetical protein
MNISFDGIGQNVATFLAEEGLSEGQVCKVTANGTVSACASGERFCGVVHHLEEDGAAAVILAGFVTLPYTGSAPTVGYDKIAAGDGGAAAANDAGGEYLVVDVDTENMTVCLYL